jgi:hypothetical protein
MAPLVTRLATERENCEYARARERTSAGKRRAPLGDDGPCCAGLDSDTNRTANGIRWQWLNECAFASASDQKVWGC